MKIKPPLPSPWPEPEEIEEPKVITKRLEWDEDEQCFFIYYLTGFAASFRGGYKAGFYYPYLMLGLVIGQPFMTLLLLYGFLTQSKKHPNEFCIRDWGFSDRTSSGYTEVTWAEITRIINHKSDIFIRRRKAITYVTRESFESFQQSHRFEKILRELTQADGANWNEVVAKYKN